jgi:AmiR/NasT family two-component response regulator
MTMRLRGCGYAGPIVVVADATDQRAQAQVLAAGANALINRPRKASDFKQPITQLLLASDQAKAEPGSKAGA